MTFPARYLGSETDRILAASPIDAEGIFGFQQKRIVKFTAFVALETLKFEKSQPIRRNPDIGIAVHHHKIFREPERQQIAEAVRDRCRALRTAIDQIDQIDHPLEIAHEEAVVFLRAEYPFKVLKCVAFGRFGLESGSARIRVVVNFSEIDPNGFVIGEVYRIRIGPAVEQIGAFSASKCIVAITCIELIGTVLAIECCTCRIVPDAVAGADA